MYLHIHVAFAPGRPFAIAAQLTSH
jgi:hypothetical protein